MSNFFPQEINISFYMGLYYVFFFSFSVVIIVERHDAFYFLESSDRLMIYYVSTTDLHFLYFHPFASHRSLLSSSSPMQMHHFLLFSSTFLPCKKSAFNDAGCFTSHILFFLYIKKSPEPVLVFLFVYTAKARHGSFVVYYNCHCVPLFSSFCHCHCNCHCFHLFFGNSNEMKWHIKDRARIIELYFQFGSVVSAQREYRRKKVFILYLTSRALNVG